MTTKIAEQIVDKLIEAIPAAPRKATPEERALHEIYIWQTLDGLASKRLKAAWTAAQNTSLVPDDETLRSKAVAQHIVAEAGNYSCLVEVGEPRLLFNRDVFIGQLVKRYKLDQLKLEALADACKAKSKAPVSKRVVEA